MKRLLLFSICILTCSTIIAANGASAKDHLQKALAYYKSGNYGRAKLEFETVLRLNELPSDIHLQTELYATLAREYLNNQRLLLSGYAITGFGNYQENSTAAGRGEINDMFWTGRPGGRLNYVVSDDITLNNSLDYRFREYSDSARRVDSDLRWNSAVSRSFDDNNLESGVRGRVSYRGNGNYRNDYGWFNSYRMLIDTTDQITLNAELRRRNYPQGPLRQRSRNIAELTGNWNHALLDGKASFSLDAFGGWEHATNDRPDGNSNFYGLLPQFNVTITEQWGGYVFFRWQNDRYNSERYTLEPSDSLVLVSTRNDDLYELGGSLTWEFKKDWSLIPQVLYIYDHSNIVFENYSSTEIWLTLRYDLQ